MARLALAVLLGQAALLALGLLALAGSAPAPAGAAVEWGPPAPHCSDFWMSGYVRSDFPGGVTFDGTPVSSREAIVSSAVLPLQSRVFVPEWATSYRVADRGELGPRQLDFLVDSRAQALELTGWRQACPE